jgi:hypothetical protein
MRANLPATNANNAVREPLAVSQARYEAQKRSNERFGDTRRELGTVPAFLPLRKRNARGDLIDAGRF